VSAVVAAPTGLAAYSINGITLHKVFCLPVEHGKPADYNKLSQDQIKTIRAILKDLRLLIVDKISMVSSLTLLYIYLRLIEIMNNDNYFGGLSVVFFGDILQLPPVKGNQPFIQVTPHEAKERKGAIGTINLWKNFQYDELTINMRQSGDQDYASLLADLRTGHIFDQQYTMLTERLITHGPPATVDEICNKYLELVSSGQSPVILLPRTAMRDEVNNAMLQRIGTEIQSLSASDKLETIVDKKLLPKIEKALKAMENDTTRTAGLEKCVQLCIGAKVMLKKTRM